MTEKISFKKLSIAILGCNGQLGQEFKFISPSFEYINFDFFSRQTLDITSADEVKNILGQSSYDYIINCAAYTAVDKAESDAEACFNINANACKYISDAIHGSDTKLVHFSSDYVYHQYSGFPLNESDPTRPRSVYAQSKLEGEQILRNADVNALILRTSWVVSSYGHNFVKTMMKLGKEKSSLSVVNDQYGAPTYARHLAMAVLDIITQVESNPNLMSAFNDTYNYANEGIVTWFDIAKEIMTDNALDCTVQPIPTSDYPTPAQRPNWSVLSKQKIKDQFKLEIPHWLTAIKECMGEIRSN